MTPREWMAQYMATMEGADPDQSYNDMADQFLDELYEVGFALVPIDPTPEMVRAWRFDMKGLGMAARVNPKRVWRVMVAAVTGRLTDNGPPAL